MEGFPECIVTPPHIIADPCRPRWVVKCEHGNWYFANLPSWTDKRDEEKALIALNKLIYVTTYFHDTFRWGSKRGKRCDKCLQHHVKDSRCCALEENVSGTTRSSSRSSG